MQIKALEEEIKKHEEKNKDTKMRHMKVVSLVQDQVVKIEEKTHINRRIRKRKQLH